MTEAETERAAVVAYLRGQMVEGAQPLYNHTMAWAAYAIERGEHLTNEGK